MRKMKSSAVAVVILLACLLAGSSVFADTTNTMTNALGQVVVTISDAYGVHSVSITPPNQPASPVITEVVLRGIRLDTNTTTVVTAFTPRDYGDIVIGQTGGTGSVWMATGPTTNDWKGLYTP